MARVSADLAGGKGLGEDAVRQEWTNGADSYGAEVNLRKLALNV